MRDEREQMTELYHVLTEVEDDTKAEVDTRKLQAITYMLCASLCVNVVLLLLAACLVVRYL